jgi:predicted Ser/Thr protein kinase
VGGFFGAPTSQGPEQDALQCARMAGEMWKRAVEICQGWMGRQVRRPPVPTLVLASGYATVGNFGSSKRLEYTAVGGPVNQAHAILSAVEPGMVACSQGTWALIKEEHEGELFGTVESPHWPEPQDLYRLDMPALASTETLDAEYASPWSPGGTDPVSSDPPTRAAAASIKRRRPAHRVKELAPGTVLAGRYAVLKKLGRGGMGVVYQVQDLKLETEIALKLLLRDFQDDPQGRKRLYREAKLARFVSHPNVARIYDLGEWEGHEFISMEYIQGRSLAQRLKTGDPIDLDQGLDVFRQICEGLAAAHLAGVIHRDLKPSNIMLEQGGRAVIMDFGIARWSPSSPQTDTGTRSTAGTPLYMSPEQFSGGDIDHRADIYALGCVAFEIFTGQRPFSADHDAGLGYQHTHLSPPHPRKLKPDLPPLLSAVILRCLRKRPADRFGRVEEITAFLTSVQPHYSEALTESPRQEKPQHDDQS